MAYKGEGALLRVVRPGVVTQFAGKTTTTSWDNGTELDLESGDIAVGGVQFVHVHCTEDVYLVANVVATDPTVNGVVYAADLTHEIPCFGQRYLHFKAVSTGGTLTVTAFGN